MSVSASGSVVQFNSPWVLVLVVDLHLNHAPPNTRHTRNQPNSRLILQLSNLLLQVTSSLSPGRNTSIWLLRFTTAFFGYTLHLFFDFFDQLYAHAFPRQMALCREFRDGLLMVLSNENVPPVVFLALSNLACNYTTTSYTQAKKNHTPYPPKILNMYRGKV